MKRTDKKGFTIVELVIVIAVIAILAAVLIPNISKLVQKANASADESLVRNLNTALSMDVEKHTTMSAALKAAKDNGGYDLETIELKGKGNKILWDSVNDCFVYLKGTEKVYLPNTQSVKKADDMKDYEYFEILETMPEDMSEQKYSIYLIGKTYTDAVTVSVGFDAGENVNIPTINYNRNATGKQDVVIYTCSASTVLNVNAEKDTVRHFGTVKEVNITKIDTASYHENGTVAGNINVAQGRVELENTATVSNVVVKTINDVVPVAEMVKVSVAQNAKVDLVISDNVNVTVDGSGKDNVKTISSIGDKKAAIGTTLYDTVVAAISAAKANDTVTVFADVAETLPFAISKNLIIDLNNHVLTNNAGCITVNTGVELKFKNGTLKMPNTGSWRVAVQILDKAGFSFDNVIFEVHDKAYGIYPAGNAAYVNILNSTVKVGVGLATNASVDKNGEYKDSKIAIDSSKIISNEIAVWINVPGDLVINNSYIEGRTQGVMVRAGTAKVSDSEIVATLSGSDCTLDFKATEAWADGNNVMCGALIVGDWNNGYKANAVCELSNTKIRTTNTSWGRALIVLSQDNGFETKLIYDSDCNLDNTKYYLHDITTKDIKKGIISVNGQIVRPADAN